MIVEAEDGGYYVNPVVFGERSYLTFENGYPEVVVASKSFKAGRRWARKFGTVVSEGDRMRRAFPPDFRGLRDSVSFRLDLTGPIQVPDSHDGRIDDLSPGDALTWTATFTREEVLSLWTGSPNQKLVQWMLDLPLATGLQVTDVVCLDNIRRRIKEQVLTLFEIPETMRLRK